MDKNKLTALEKILNQNCIFDNRKYYTFYEIKKLFNLNIDLHLKLFGTKPLINLRNL